MRTRIGLVVLLSLLIALALPGLASAKGPAQRITIVGPGLEGELEIVNDAALLNALSMTMLEDFMQPVDPPARPAPGFEITRFYEANTGGYVPFDVVVYHPAPEGEPGAIYYDGIVNGSSEYDGRWFRTNPKGEAALREALAAHGANLDAVATVTTPYLALSGQGSRFRLIDLATLEPAVAWQIGASEVMLVRVTAAPRGDALWVEALEGRGARGTLRLDLASGRACLLKMPGEVVTAVPDGENLIVANWRDHAGGSGPSAALDVRRAETLDLAAAIPVPGGHRATQHSPSPDGRQIATLHHGAGETWLGVFDTYTRKYVTDRRLATLSDGAMLRLAWDAAGGTIYVIDGQRVYRFSTASLEFMPYQGFELVDQDRAPLGGPGALFEIAGARDGTLYLYRPAERDGGAGTGGIYVVRAVLGRLSQHLWPDLPLIQAIMHGETIYALEAPNIAGDAALWALDLATGEGRRVTTLRKGEEMLSLVWLDPAAVPTTRDRVIRAGCN